MALDKIGARKHRKKSIRQKVSGTADRPRLTVFRSNKHMYAQVVDDINATSIAAVSTQSKALATELDSKKKAERAKLVGQAIAKACLEKGVKRVVFDRNGYQYHGRVSALAAGAREGGLSF